MFFLSANTATFELRTWTKPTVAFGFDAKGTHVVLWSVFLILIGWGKIFGRSPWLGLWGGALPFFCGKQLFTIPTKRVCLFIIKTARWSVFVKGCLAGNKSVSRTLPCWSGLMHHQISSINIFYCVLIKTVICPAHLDISDQAHTLLVAKHHKRWNHMHAYINQFPNPAP